MWAGWMLTLRDGISLEDAVSHAVAEANKSDQAGVSIKVLEQVARTGLGNGAFEDSEEESPAIVEEFYPDVEAGGASGQPVNQTIVPVTTKLAGKYQVAVLA